MTTAYEPLVELIAEVPSCLVAFSGGVDSAVVAKAAFLALGDRALADTRRARSSPLRRDRSRVQGEADRGGVQRLRMAGAGHEHAGRGAGHGRRRARVQRRLAN